MTVTLPQPKSGRRGDLTPLALRDRPFHQEHAASVRTPTPPQTFAALAAWFRDAWEASLPTRSHTRGVEDCSALGSPRMSGALHARTDHVSDRGWGVTGWDKDGRPRGMNADGLTRDPFLFYLEIRLRKGEPEAEQLIHWAYVGWDVDEAANNAFVRRIRSHEEDPEGWALFRVGFEALLERGIRRLWHDCQREPIRYAICAECRRRECVCGRRSEAQLNAEGYDLRDPEQAAEALKKGSATINQVRRAQGVA